MSNLAYGERFGPLNAKEREIQVRLRILKQLEEKDKIPDQGDKWNEEEPIVI